jgi:hypothetical protein
MADKLDNAVRFFLRPSEDVKITLETLIAGKRTAEEDDGKNQRVLAVVTHQNEAGKESEGRCVLYRPMDCRSRCGLMPVDDVLPDR